MELVAPAGGMEQLQMAVHFGADAVYLSGKHWGMRAGAKNFSDEELAQAVGVAHEAGTRVYLATNVLMHDEDLEPDALPAFFARAAEMGVDGFIVSDLGALACARESSPSVELHLSTQASCMNARAACEYARLGVSRIVLAREMTIEQIAALRRAVPRELGLEAFVHGSVCMAYSGRCLLSAELMGPERSANAGACAQPCRWGWELADERESSRRIGIETDERGSYLLSSNDLNMLEHLDELEAAGVDAIKIEGRSKGSYYVACVTNAYRHVLDGCAPEPWASELELVSHRPYSTGFYYGEPTQNPGRVDYARERRLIGVVRACSPCEDGLWEAEVECRNRALAPCTLDVLSPGYDVRHVALTSDLITNGATYRLDLPFPVLPLDIMCE